MIKGLILADDLTGALDSGVELSSRGCRTVVQLGWKPDFSALAVADAQVAVINCDSRHLDRRDAYDRLHLICMAAKRSGVSLIYKKVDSALRGNVGAELSALLDCMRQPVALVPAFPAMRRSLEKGIVLIDGVPVAKSIFGNDPFTPVNSSHICDILHESAGELSVTLHTAGDEFTDFVPAIHAVDASTDEDLARIAGKLKSSSVGLFAGCAGFAGQLPYLWDLDRHQIQIPVVPQKLLVFSGSVNAVTIGQLKYGRDTGMHVHTMDDSTLKNPSLFPYEAVLRALDRKHGVIVEAISTEDGNQVSRSQKIDGRSRGEVADNLGEIAARLTRETENCLPLIIGGDTLSAVMAKLNCRHLYPLVSVSIGTVLALADCADGSIPILTKSGGLGPVDLLDVITAFLRDHGR